MAKLVIKTVDKDSYQANTPLNATELVFDNESLTTVFERLYIGGIHIATYINSLDAWILEPGHTIEEIEPYMNRVASD